MGTGLGSEVKDPMLIAIISELISSMILKLLVVPALYYRMINPIDRWFRKWYELGRVE